MTQQKQSKAKAKPKHKHNWQPGKTYSRDKIGQVCPGCGSTRIITRLNAGLNSIYYPATGLTIEQKQNG